MRNDHIEKEIMLALKCRNCGAKRTTLESEVATRLDNPLMSETKFADTLSRLVTRRMVACEITPLGSELFSLTSLGEQAMQEEGWL